MQTKQQQAEFRKWSYIFTMILIAVASYGIYIKDPILLMCMSFMAILWQIGISRALYDALYHPDKSERRYVGVMLVVFVCLLVLLAPYQTYTYVSYHAGDNGESSTLIVVPNTRTTILTRYFEDTQQVKYIGDLNGTLYIIKLDGACDGYRKNRTINFQQECTYMSEHIEIMRSKYGCAHSSDTELVADNDYEFRLIITEPYSDVVVDDVYKRVRM